MSLDGLDAPVRAGSLLQDGVVAPCKFIDLSTESLEHVLDVRDAGGGWIV